MHSNIEKRRRSQSSLAEPFDKIQQALLSIHGQLTFKKRQQLVEQIQSTVNGQPSTAAASPVSFISSPIARLNLLFLAPHLIHQHPFLSVSIPDDIEECREIARAALRLYLHSSLPELGLELLLRLGSFPHAASDTHIQWCLKRITYSISDSSCCNAALKWYDELAAMTVVQAQLYYHDNDDDDDDDDIEVEQHSTPKRRRQNSEAHTDTVVDIAGIKLRSSEGTIPAPSSHPSPQTSVFVSTPTTERNLQRLAMGLLLSNNNNKTQASSSLGLLVSSSTPGAGKSRLIKHAATLLSSDCITIYLDAAADSKSLLGAYVCGSKPGEFSWTAGPLTRAARKGCWVLIENLDLAPPEVLASLAPLLERGELNIAARGETIKAAPGFQLIATVAQSTQPITDLLGCLFHHVEVELPPKHEQLVILLQLYPELGEGLLAQSLEMPTIARAARTGRYYGLRDVLKWCTRMRQQQEERGGLPDRVSLTLADVPLPLREAAFVHGVECFAAADKIIVSEFASLWCVLAETVDQYLHLAKPNLRVDEGGGGEASSREGMSIVIGRARLPSAHKKKRHLSLFSSNSSSSKFAATGHAMRNMERIATAISHIEPVLLVGETGTGKTTLVQQIAKCVGAKLVVLNLSQQTDSSDLLGGFKPLEAVEAVFPLLNKFASLVRSTWSKGKNEEYLDRITRLIQKRKWPMVIKAFRGAVDKGNVSKRTTTNNGDGQKGWEQFGKELSEVEASITAAEGGLAFTFVEGALVKALKEGAWLLLDEINLAPPEALERIAGLLEDAEGSLVITERGDATSAIRHPGFRLFGAMNPATDAGKKDLPGPFRSRFTELWIAEPYQREDLAAIVSGYLTQASAPIEGIVDFYLGAKKEAEVSLQDAAGHKPAYNLRTLCRSLEYAAMTSPIYGLQRALYDGLCMSFITQLEPAGGVVLERIMKNALFAQIDLKRLLSIHPTPPGPQFTLFDQYWVEIGPEEEKTDNLQEGAFILTPTVTNHLRNLARAVLLRKYPILLQGPTSSGKTSLVAYLAKQTRHKFVRINNHEQTDLQEYLGSYVSDTQGRLMFREGLLVKAVRQGHWIVLDELNLAPTEVLEALNRLLDDNRELYVPELQETIKPHPHFMLFATQNPPGIYAGRKTLSRAFRSRFLELHVDDIPEDELTVILEKRCKIAPSYAIKLVTAMKELQRRRATSNVFAGRHGFITPRDLFRWANREAVGYQQLAEDGFAVLGERLRTEDEQEVVKEVLEKVMAVKLNVAHLYNQTTPSTAQNNVNNNISEGDSKVEDLMRGVVWTASMRRMYWLLDRCLTFSEPALFVGETGTGKTTVCQIATFARGQKLRMINCNQHTEVSDFLGGFRPNRQRSKAIATLMSTIKEYNAHPIVVDKLDVPDQPTTAEFMSMVAVARHTLEQAGEGHTDLHDIILTMNEAYGKGMAPFEWCDGPLVLAMKEGDILLIDELNLADDAVLERLNSVLEPGRTLTLAEKGGADADIILAHPNFRIVATMNPGGDFGKKELSPALSNRFTSIWVPAIDDIEEVRAILERRMSADMQQAIAPRMLEFWAFFKQKIAYAARQVLSVRDLLAWAQFIDAVGLKTGLLAAYVHGAHLVLLDGIGLGVGISAEAAVQLRHKCLDFLDKQLSDSAVAAELRANPGGDVMFTDDTWGISPFYVERRSSWIHTSFGFNAPTTSKNALRVLRALQLRKPLLLEGSPGVGKTSLVSAMAKATGNELVRINLSEQTDMMDLLGADLPVHGGAPGQFAWSDGPLLHAIKSGAWVLLDELNLANQTILEGLNAILDHRAEVFIPELGTSFHCPPNFHVFAAQNPVQEGGGRKGLPKSFLNRFSRVHVDLLQTDDLLFVTEALYPQIPRSCHENMVAFVQRLHSDVHVSRIFGNLGGPWEFNLRDLLRWCELSIRGDCLAAVQINNESEEEKWHASILHFVPMLFVERLRTAGDRGHAWKLLKDIWGSSTLNALLSAGKDSLERQSRDVFVTPDSLQVGWARLSRNRSSQGNHHDSSGLALLNSQAHILEWVGECITMQWMCLLVGPSGTGKTALVRTLALLCGEPLVELSLNSGTDTSDLLGGFEQVDVTRKIAEVTTQVDGIFHAAASSIVHSGNVDCLTSLSKLWCEWKDLTRAGRGKRDVEDEALLLPSVTALLKQLDSLLSFSSMVVDEDQSGESVAAHVNKLLQVAILLEEELSGADGTSTAGRFEWVDGTLTRAIEHGQWVLLDNANLCNPTVLDRLNPLLEPNGTLFLNECGIGPEGPRILKPHPNFKLFLAFDPRHGEVSRAMRNRGIELYLLPSTAASKEMGQAETEMVLNLQGLPGYQLPECLAKTHQEVAGQAMQRHSRPPSLRELQRWGDLLVALRLQGWTLRQALVTAFEQVYLQSERSQDAREMARQSLDRHCSSLLLSSPLSSSSSRSLLSRTLYRPASWPIPLSVSSFATDPILSQALRDSDVVLYHIARLLHLDDYNATTADAALGGFATAMATGLDDSAPHHQQKEEEELVGMKMQALVATSIFVEHTAYSDDKLRGEFFSKLLNHVHATFEAGAAAATNGGGSSPALQTLRECIRLHGKRKDMFFIVSDNTVRLAMKAVQNAAQAHAIMAVAYDETDASIDHNAPTLLQVSITRQEKKGSVSSPHTCVDWLWPLLSAIQAAEIKLLSHQGEEEGVIHCLVAVQEWRWAILILCHISSHKSVGVAQNLASKYERLVFSWSKLREAIRNLGIISVRNSNWREERDLLTQAASQLDAAFGFGSGPPIPPLLWQRGSRPLVAKTLELFCIQSQLLALCDAFSAVVDGEGFKIDHRGHPALLSAAGILIPSLKHAADHCMLIITEENDDDDDSRVDICLSPHQKRVVAEAIAASLASDLRLKIALLEGACLLGASLSLEVSNQRTNNKNIAGLYQLITKELKRTALQVAEQAIEFVQDLPTAAEDEDMDGVGSVGGGGSPSLEVLPTKVPHADLKWGDTVPINSSSDNDSWMNGVLPKTLPAELMMFASCRDMNLGLLGLQDTGMSSRIFLKLASSSCTGLLRADCCAAADFKSISKVQEDGEHKSTVKHVERLRRLASECIVSGCRSTAEASVYLQMAWLLGAGLQFPLSLEMNSKDNIQICLALIHEGWFRWLQSCQAGNRPSDCLSPTLTSFLSSPEHAQRWQRFAGPMRHHLATRSVFALSIAGSSDVPIADRSAKVLQLKLAARELRMSGQTTPGSSLLLARLEWTSTIYLFASTLEPYLPTISNVDMAAQLKEGLKWLVEERVLLVMTEGGDDELSETVVESQASLLRLVSQTLEDSNHDVLRHLAQPVFVTCLMVLLLDTKASSDTGPYGLSIRGKAMALLGLARLHLLSPPAGSDPAAEYSLLRQHLLQVKDVYLGSELRVRRQLQLLPAGPDQSAAIEDLESSMSQLEKKGEELESQCTPRPTPSLYFALREDILRFMSGFVDVEHLVVLINSMSEINSSDEQIGQKIRETESWRENAASWSKRLSTAYPAYRDVVQPVQMAALEIQYGLSLMVGAQVLHRDRHVATVSMIVSRLMEYPRSSLPAVVDLQSGDVQQVTTTVAAVAMAERLGAVISQHHHCEEDLTVVKRKQQAAADTAGMVARLKLLAVAMKEAANEAKSLQSGVASLPAACPLSRRLSSIFSSFVAIWEEMKVEEERRAIEEAEVFKTKPKKTDIPDEEQEDEEDYKLLFPDEFSTYDDIAGDEEGNLTTTDGDGNGNRNNQAEDNRLGAAAISAGPFLYGDLLNDMVQCHSQAFATIMTKLNSINGTTTTTTTTTSSIPPSGTSPEEFMQAYKLGASLVKDIAGIVSPEVDEHCCGGHLLSMSQYYARLSSNPASLSSSAGGTNGNSNSNNIVDVRKPCVEEAVLVQQPLVALKSRLASLLSEWPGHPILIQLQSIADRVLSLHLDHPLKKVMVGVELLLARSRVWEETAANHVSLATELTAIAGLATRWRRLELSSWQSLLTTTVARVAAGARKGWFHLHRLLVQGALAGAAGPGEGEVTVEDVAVTVEQFIQGAPLGEYVERLKLLESFADQLTALASLPTSAVVALITGKEQERYLKLASILRNLKSHHMNFLPVVEKSITGSLKPLEKHLHDFVALAKWEDRGYYAMKQSTEQAQRQLHRLTRKAEAALKEPAQSVVAGAAAALGFDDLTQHHSSDGGDIVSDDADIINTFLDSSRAVAAFEKVATASLAAAEKGHHMNKQSLPAAATTTTTTIIESSKYLGKASHLNKRFKQVASTALSPSSCPNTSSMLAADDLASQAASRALELREDISKGAKARKKKALTDLFHALIDAGVSKRRTAVPSEYRGAASWLQLKPPNNSKLQAMLSIEGRQLWSKSDAYYYKTMVRMQRLYQAAESPHQDLVMTEVETAVRSSEHLMYMMQHGRRTLDDLEACYSKLTVVLGVLNSLQHHHQNNASILTSISTDESQLPLPPQTLCNSWSQDQRSRLCYLIQQAEEMRTLLDAAAGAETAPKLKAPLLCMSQAVSALIQALHCCWNRLTTAISKSVVLSSGPLFITPDIHQALSTNATDIIAVAQSFIQTTTSIDGVGNSNDDNDDAFPLLRQLKDSSLVKAALEEENVLRQCNDLITGDQTTTNQQQQSSAEQEIVEAIDKAIAAALVWAQMASSPEFKTTSQQAADNDDNDGNNIENERIPDLLSSLEKQLCSHRAIESVNHVLAALTVLSSCDRHHQKSPDITITSSNYKNHVLAVVPMVTMLHHVLGHLAQRYVAFHKTICKLGYVCSSLFTGLVQQGFCMPEEEAGEAQGGGEKMTEGTGLGDGDTRGAKDISDELEDEDQLLGAQQKGKQQEEEDHEQDEEAQPEGEQPKGIEMDEDFEGALEDVHKDPNAASDEDEDEGDEEERLDQQMGDAGDAAEAVDERVWKDDKGGDEDDSPPENQGYDDEKAIGVQDKSDLEYNTGQDKEEEEENENKEDEDDGKGPQDGGAQQAPDQPQPDQDDENEGEAGEDDGEAGEAETNNGFVQPEAAEQEFELPKDLNLDEGDGGGDVEEEGGEGEGEKGADQDDDDGKKQQEEKEGAVGDDDTDMPDVEVAGLPDDNEMEDGDEEKEGEQPPQPAPADGQAIDDNNNQEELDEDAQMHQAEQSDDQQQDDQQQGGTQGLQSNAALINPDADDAAAQADGVQDDNHQAAHQDAAAATTTALEQSQPPPRSSSGGATTTGGAAGGKDQDPVANILPPPPPQQRQQQQEEGGPQPPSSADKNGNKQSSKQRSEANPFRNLGDALERWKAKLSVTTDVSQQQQEEDKEPTVDGSDDVKEEDASPQDPAAAAEYRFLGKQESIQAGDAQTLASATEEQGADGAAQKKDEDAMEEEDGAGNEEDDDDGGGETALMDEDDEGGGEDEEGNGDGKVANGVEMQWPAGANKKTGITHDKKKDKGDKTKTGQEGEKDGQEEGVEKTGDDDDDTLQVLKDEGGSYVVSKLAAASLEDSSNNDLLFDPETSQFLPCLSEERIAELRAELDRRLKLASEQGVVGAVGGQQEQEERAALMEYGQEVWERCEALTSGLVGELTEQLRLILDPTLASKLAGDYQSGKRLNMKKVIAYVASHFKKDKIWMRRTRPDKRKYQVVVAVDDSKSMAATACGGFAAEAVALICRAMARLEVGDLGVVSFGGTGGVTPLHSLGKPFTGVDGASVMAGLRFDQDNTIADKPMTEVIASLDILLEDARNSQSSSSYRGGGGGYGSSSSLHQLVLIVADGRFHEKEALQRAVRAAADKPGVLYAFIVLDNPSNSLLDMQTVSFEGGKPVFTKYMDSFPFPFYIVLRDIAALPRTLADLLRQWFEISSHAQ